MFFKGHNPSSCRKAKKSTSLLWQGETWWLGWRGHFRHPPGDGNELLSRVVLDIPAIAVPGGKVHDQVIQIPQRISPQNCLMALLMSGPRQMTASRFVYFSNFAGRSRVSADWRRKAVISSRSRPTSSCSWA